MAEFGAPNDVFSRNGSLTNIHSPDANNTFLDPIQDYFFNYFDLGIDVFFDGHTHKVKKLVLHTNLITKSDFGRYRKCHFQLRAKEDSNWITPQTKWPDIEKIIGDAGDPLVLNHGSNQENVLIRSSYVYAYRGILFEVNISFCLSLN
jgi:hypothetical protein